MSVASIEHALYQDWPGHWPQTEAEVTDCRRVHGDTRRWDGGGPDPQLPHYTVGFAYTVGGARYTGVLSSTVQVEPRDTFPIRYNPDHPDQNNSLASEIDHSVVFRDYTWAMGALILGIMVVDFVRRNFFHSFLR
jgi:hypothetical protein